MSVMSVNASQKTLRAKLESKYDLQLAQKKKEIESRKLLESVAKTHKKINIRNDQQKNIKNNNSVKTKPQKSQQRKKELYRRYEPSFFERYHDLFFLGSIGMAPLIVMGYNKLFLDIPIGCFERYTVCKCLYM